MLKHSTCVLTASHKSTAIRGAVSGCSPLVKVGSVTPTPAEHSRATEGGKIRRLAVAHIGIGGHHIADCSGLRTLDSGRVILRFASSWAHR